MEQKCGEQGSGRKQKIATEMGRRILRCPSKTTNAAVRGELGWWRQSTRRDYIKLRYYVNILLMEEKRLVKEVYNHSRREFVTKNRNNWAKTIYQIINKYTLQELWENEQYIKTDMYEDKSVQEIKAYWMKKIYKKVQEKEEFEWNIEVERKTN